MTKQVNVAEAKAKLSQLLDDDAAGEDVVIARAGRPVARLVPVADPPARVLGFFPIDVPDELFAPLTDAELEEWEHRDPFDRILAAQAMSMDLSFVSTDAAFRTLGGLRVVW